MSPSENFLKDAPAEITVFCRKKYKALVINHSCDLTTVEATPGKQFRVLNNFEAATQHHLHQTKNDERAEYRNCHHSDHNDV